MHHPRWARRALHAALAAVVVLVLAGEPGSATQIGPDAFGYTATDEVTYTFEDLSLSLASTRILAGQNDASTLVPIGFSFGFYGTAHNELYVSTNGLLSFGESYHWFVNRALDSPLLIGDPRLIAPLWHDWTFEGDPLQPANDAVYYDTLGSPSSQRFVVQWNRAYNDTPTLSDPVTFQAVLYENGNILFHYFDVTTLVTPSNHGGSATVGIRNAGGTASGEFLQWSYDEPVLADGQTILFTVPEPASASLLLAALAVLAARCRSGKHRRTTP